MLFQCNCNMKLKEIREHLDRLDSALLIILAERMSFIPKVADYKIKNNLELFQKEREDAIFKEKKELAKKYNLNEELVVDIFKRIIKESLDIEKKISHEKN